MARVCVFCIGKLSVGILKAVIYATPDNYILTSKLVPEVIKVMMSQVCPVTPGARTAFVTMAGHRGLRCQCHGSLVAHPRGVAWALSWSSPVHRLVLMARRSSVENSCRFNRRARDSFCEDSGNQWLRCSEGKVLNYCQVAQRGVLRECHLIINGKPFFETRETGGCGTHWTPAGHRVTRWSQPTYLGHKVSRFVTCHPSADMPSLQICTYCCHFKCNKIVSVRMEFFVYIYWGKNTANT